MYGESLGQRFEPDKTTRGAVQPNHTKTILFIMPGGENKRKKQQKTLLIFRKFVIM